MTEYQNAPDTVDIIIERDEKILLIKRGNDPFKNLYALPGGYVDYGEKVEHALIREGVEELNVEIIPIAILGVYSGQERDPRGPTISTVFVCDFNGKPTAGDDAKSLHWIDLDSYLDFQFAFDHNQIISDYLKWRKIGKTYWSSKNRMI